MSGIAGLPPPPPEEAWQPPPPTDPLRPDVELADWGQRARAAALDFGVRLGILVACVLLARTLLLAGQVVGIGGADTIGLGAAFAGVIVGLLAGLAYAPVMMTRTSGQTVGHRAVGTRVVTAGGAPIAGGRAVVREVLVKALLIEMLIGGVSFYVLTLLNYLWPLWDPRNEALHDKICSTRVVKV